jgi:hypothetical protein
VSTPDAYQGFIQSKVCLSEATGMDLDPDLLHPALFPHQRDMVLWAMRRGTGLIAAAFGLGKTIVQTELARLISSLTGKRFLLVCPLGVKHQFIEEDGPRLGVYWQYVRTDAEVRAATSAFLITNYERIQGGQIDPRLHDFGGVSLDEGAILRDLSSKTYNVAVGAIFTSTPFGTLYEYSDQYEDFGHNEDAARFFAQMGFLAPQLYRVLEPGRCAVFHVKDRVLYSHNSGVGMMAVYPFAAEMTLFLSRHGFVYEGECTIVTDVVCENNQTYRLSYGEMRNDSSKMGWGLNEKLLLFRKPPSDLSTARADRPVAKEADEYSLARWQIDASGFWRSDGKALALDPYNYEAHVEQLERLEARGNLPKDHFHQPPQSPSPLVWTDVNRMHGLNLLQARRGEENHVCPLPFDITRRVIDKISMPGDLVLDPFAGIGTVPYVAIARHRRAYGVELNVTYWQQAVRYCREQEELVMRPRLPGMEEVAA